MNKKVMFVMNQMTSGGAERVVSILANNMIDYNFDVSLVITFTSDIHYNLNSNINIINLNISRNSSQIDRNLKEIRELISTFKKEKPDIIISFIRNVNSIIAAKYVGIPIIISERNNPKYDPKSRFWRVARKLVYPFSDGVVFQTEGARLYYSKYIRDKSCIIQNPLQENMPKKEVYDIESKSIVTIGRLSAQKNQKTLINAFYNIHKKYPQYKLFIYGEGELRQELEQLIRDLGIVDSVIMPGSIKNIHERIVEADIFVFTSLYEGYPNALIEAMAIGLPVISTECDYGPEDIINNDINGILVPIGDSNKLEIEIERLINDKNKRQKMGLSASNIKNELNEKIICEKWIKYINEIIS